MKYYFEVIKSNIIVYIGAIIFTIILTEYIKYNSQNFDMSNLIFTILLLFLSRLLLEDIYQIDAVSNKIQFELHYKPLTELIFKRVYNIVFISTIISLIINSIIVVFNVHYDLIFLIFSSLSIFNINFILYYTYYTYESQMIRKLCSTTLVFLFIFVGSLQIVGNMMTLAIILTIISFIIYLKDKYV